MADSEGFELSDTLLHHTLSKRAHSTTLPTVLKCPMGCGRKLASNTSDSKLFLCLAQIINPLYFKRTAGIPRLWFLSKVPDAKPCFLLFVIVKINSSLLIPIFT